MATILTELPMQDNAASTVVVARTSANATSVNNTSGMSVAGPGGSYPLALSTNGTTDCIQTPTLAWSGLKQASVMFWLYVASNPGATAVLFESGPDWTGSQGKVIYYTTTAFQVGQFINGLNTGTYSRPSTGTWHHIACLWDVDGPAANPGETTYYLNGVVQTRAGLHVSDNTSTYTSQVVNLGARNNGASLPLAMRMAGFKAYSGLVSVTEILDDMQLVKPQGSLGAAF